MKSIITFFMTLFIISSEKLLFTEEITHSSILDFFEKNLPKEFKNGKITAFSSTSNYSHTLLPSLTPYLFEDLQIIENIAPITNNNRPGKKKKKYMICVHDTGSFRYGSKGWSNVVKYGHHPDGWPYEVSYQYVVGNEGIYHNIPDDENAFHAGDRSVEYEEYKSGVKVENNENIHKPNITISEDGYYEINKRIN